MPAIPRIERHDIGWYRDEVRRLRHDIKKLRERRLADDLTLNSVNIGGGTFAAGPNGISNPQWPMEFHPIKPAAGTAAPNVGPYGWELLTNSTAATGLVLARHYGLKFSPAIVVVFSGRITSTYTGTVRIVNAGDGSVLAPLNQGAWSQTFTSTTDVLFTSPPLVLPGSIGSVLSLGISVGSNNTSGIAVAQFLGAYGASAS